VSDDRRLPDSPRYRLDSRIATGGMGEVWRSTDTVLGREVAVKVLKPEYADDPTFRSRFETEARNAAALHHPNVASVFDFGELPASDGGVPQPYLVMELVRGEPLSALLRGGERMPAETASDLVSQAADGIAAAHKLGIVHRDVKPANLLVTPDGTVKITDFGIARAADAVALTQTGQVVGTPQYLSPEQAEGKPATEASDIYSLGVVLYECLAGRRPFDADSAIATALSHLRDEPPPLPDDVPAHLRETVRVALAKDPAARFASARDFASALHGGPVQGGPGTAAPIGADDPTRVGGLAGAPVAGAAAGAAAAGAAGAAGAANRDDPGTRVLTGTSPAGADPGPPRRPSPAPAGGRRRLPPWLLWLAAAAAVLLVIFVIARIADDRSADTTSTDQPTEAGPSEQTSGKPTPTKSAKASKAPTTPKDDRVTVDPSDYIGRPADDAKNDLEELGFDVDEETVDNPGDQPEDTVADVSPSGRVDPDQTLTLSVYDEPQVVETPTVPDPGEGNGKGKGNDSEAKDKKK
jgi:eukaryotic-like serine/threonine-protein kinase